MEKALRLRLTPVMAVLVVVATAIPVEVRRPVFPEPTFDVIDFAANVLLYAPLGFVLQRRSFSMILLIAIAISASTETLQIWTFGRFSSPFDVLANVCGAAVGAAAARLVSSRMLPVDSVALERLTIPAIVIAAGVAVSTIPVTANNLSDWNLDFELLLGNERTGDRPWEGTISSLALIPSEVSRSELREMNDPANPVLRKELENWDAYVLVEPIHLDGGEAIALPADIAQRFGRSARTRNAFTVVAWIESAGIRQAGPARIVTFSRDQFNRNFDLGQAGERLVFRVRTPTTGANGNDRRTETREILESDRELVVAATYDGGIGRIYVNGQLQGRSNLAAAGCLVPALCDAGMPLASTVLGGCFAVVALTLAVPKRRRTMCAIALLAAGASAILLLLVQFALAAANPGSWMQVMHLAGGLCIAAAVTDAAVSEAR
jgi:VanZ family protein